MLRITIDRDRCVGSGNCAFWAPATFDLDEEGFSVVLDPMGDTEDRVRVAAEGCPSKAISVEDEPTDAGAPAREGHDADRAVR
jgi:ferredoxin